MMDPGANEEHYGGEGPAAGRRPSGGANGAEEVERVREAMDRLLAVHLEREDAREREEKLESEAPDPHRTFTGINEMLDFNEKRAAHEAEAARARERREQAEKEYARASDACAFVPERSAVYHAFCGAVFLVRREPAPVSYADRAAAEGETEDEAAPGAPGGAGGGVFFVITFQGNEEGGGAGQEAPTSALEAQRRTPVGERMAGERTGRGAARRRGRREGPG